MIDLFPSLHTDDTILIGAYDSVRFLAINKEAVKQREHDYMIERIEREKSRQKVRAQAA